MKQHTWVSVGCIPALNVSGTEAINISILNPCPKAHRGRLRGGPLQRIHSGLRRVGLRVVDELRVGLLLLRLRPPGPRPLWDAAHALHEDMPLLGDELDHLRQDATNRLRPRGEKKRTIEKRTIKTQKNTESFQKKVFNY